MNGAFEGRFYQISKWLSNFFLINVYWGLLSLLGLFLFGFFPATVALFTVVRRWIKNGIDIPVFQSMWIAYKKDFIKSNGLGAILTIIGFILYIDISYLMNTNIFLLRLLVVPNIIISMFVVLSLLYVFPVYVHFDTGLRNILKNSLILVVSKPFTTVTLLLLLLSFMFATYQLSYFILISFSVYAFLTMKICYKQFVRS